MAIGARRKSQQCFKTYLHPSECHLCNSHVRRYIAHTILPYLKSLQDSLQLTLRGNTDHSPPVLIVLGRPDPVRKVGVGAGEGCGVGSLEPGYPSLHFPSPATPAQDDFDQVTPSHPQDRMI